MNEISRIETGPGLRLLAHAITTYSVITDLAVDDFLIPAPLDALALKIAEVPVDDSAGEISYKLQASQIAAFRFIFGMQASKDMVEYYLEPAEISGGDEAFDNSVSAALLEASPGLQTTKFASRRITESELTIPTLRLLSAAPTGMSTSELIGRLTLLFRPAGEDAEILKGRSDTFFSQKVRNMVSHRHNSGSFIRRGFAEYNDENHGLKLTERGSSLLRIMRYEAPNS